MKEDYSLAGMIRNMTAAKGKPLTEKELAKVKAMHDEIAAAQKALADHEAKEADERANDSAPDRTTRQLSEEAGKEELKVLKAQLEAVEELEIMAWVEQAEKYSWREGVLQDYGEAVKWYRKAAEHGDATAQYNLGVFYDQGKGVGQDFAEAAQWYRKAAEQGYASAQNNLGACYYAGQGVPQDHTEAVKWYRNAAEQGHADAQFNLGYCYTFGKGVPEDHTEAHKWYSKAAAQGHASAHNELDSRRHQNIVCAFSDIIAEHMPLIGDCSLLPYPKKEILYAIAWVRDHYSETMSEERYDRISSTLNYLLAVLARDWHEIDPEDRAAIAELGKADSVDLFPEWAHPLKLKYINEDKAREEALDATLEVMRDRVAGSTMSADPSDPDYGSRSTLVTKAEYEVAVARLKAHFQGVPASLDSTKTNVKPPTIYHRVYDLLVKLMRKFKPPLR